MASQLDCHTHEHEIIFVIIFLAKQQEAHVKRTKLSYKELGVCDEEADMTWDQIMTQAQGTPYTKCDIQLLNSAILRGEFPVLPSHFVVTRLSYLTKLLLQPMICCGTKRNFDDDYLFLTYYVRTVNLFLKFLGVPAHKRGQVWQFFIQQHRIGNEGNDANSCYLSQNVTYDQLLQQLTSHQHAILIDLGKLRCNSMTRVCFLHSMVPNFCVTNLVFFFRSYISISSIF